MSDPEPPQAPEPVQEPAPQPGPEQTPDEVLAAKHGTAHALAHGGDSMSPKYKLAVAAIGIVFGDIGTSPLYAFRETFSGHHHLSVDELHLMGVVSLIFWSMTIVVTIKYVGLLMKADNKGQGGTLALVALISRFISRSKYGWIAVALGVFATALFYGDSMITPTVSVLSAVEGLTVVEERLQPWVIPISLVLLVGLFVIQKRGTAKVGALFAPIMVTYFIVLAVLGVVHIVQSPEILYALNPYYAVRFFVEDGYIAFLALGSVVLAVTGSEALYSDMGHFGRGPMRLSWFGFVMPCLLLNYFGQGAMIMGMEPAEAAEAIKNPFFILAPEMLRLPLVLLATSAAVIASQAVITGAFSVTHQAIQLGFIPRLSIRHTSESEAGQIYIERDLVQRTRYLIDNGGDRPMKLLVKHPRLPGARLFKPPAGTEDNVGTLTALVPIELRTRGKAELTVDERRANQEPVDWIDPLADDAVRGYLGDARANPAIAQKLKDAWVVRDALRKHTDEFTKLANERQELERLTDETRRSLRAIEKNPQAADLRQKLTKRLSDASTRIDAITKRSIELQMNIDEQQVRFRDAVQDLKLDAPLPLKD